MISLVRFLSNRIGWDLACVYLTPFHLTLSAQFPNCLAYATKEEFVGNLYYAMTHSPEPLSPESLHALSWEAATERLMAAACIPVEEAEAFKAALAAREASIEVGMCSQTVHLRLPR
jgi:hypothetical protein